MIREAVKDKSYRATPLGLLVGRYLRWFRNEWGATATTIRDYEAMLARMALTLADRDPLEVSVEDLRDVIDLWADREARTRAKVTSVVRAFWAGPKSRITSRSRLRRSCGGLERRGRARPLLPVNTDARLLNVTTTSPRDRVALLLLLDPGLRRSELTGVRVQ